MDTELTGEEKVLRQAVVKMAKVNHLLDENPSL
jgi:hypothetical protein